MLTLPLHYCYGLSVLTSHLYAGGGDDRHRLVGPRPVLVGSVPQHRATGLAGVPHTFDQLDAFGFPTALPPALRHPGRRQAGARSG